MNAENKILFEDICKLVDELQLLHQSELRYLRRKLIEEIDKRRRLEKNLHTLEATSGYKLVGIKEPVEMPEESEE